MRRFGWKKARAPIMEAEAGGHIGSENSIILLSFLRASYARRRRCSSINSGDEETSA
jgi:hypothetical protein